MTIVTNTVFNIISLLHTKNEGESRLRNSVIFITIKFTILQIRGKINKTKAVMELRQRIINTKTSLPSSGRQKLIEPSHPEFVTDKQADSCEAGSQSRDFLPSLLSIKLTECR